MKWNLEWNDIRNIKNIIKASRNLDKLHMKKTYDKLMAEKDMRFCSGLGDAFLQEYARIIHGISDYDLGYLERDAAYIERTIQHGMEWEEDIWTDLYELVKNNPGDDLCTLLGQKFIEIFGEKLALENNKDFQELQHDFRQIEKIYKKVDFDNEEKSKKTVKMLADHEAGIFHTKLGFFFMNQMQRDMHAEDSAQRVQRIGLKALVYVLLAGCISFGSIGIYVKIHSANKLEELKQQKNEVVETTEYVSVQTHPESGDMESVSEGEGKESLSDPETEKPENEETLDTEVKKYKILKEYKNLVKQYPNLWGWIRIPDTRIDYPIMQSEEAEFYLEHDYEGEKTHEGAVFVDANSSNVPLDKFVVVYAHNMKNGNMFGDLDHYSDESYLKKHRTIYFDTLYEKGTYEVVTALRTRILNQDEEGFRYYQQFGYQNSSEFKKIKKFVVDNQLFNQKITFKEGEQLLFLSTCEYSQENGRFVVVARKSDNEE